MLTHDVTGKVMLVERYISLPTHRPSIVIDARSKISRVKLIVNGRFGLPDDLSKINRLEPDIKLRLNAN